MIIYLDCKLVLDLMTIFPKCKNQNYQYDSYNASFGF